jgi:hypothetical protein
VSDDEMSVALLESLRRANPVPVDEVANRRDLPSAHALFAEITAERPRRVRRRTIVIAIALVVVALAALVGAFALVDRSQPEVTAPRCYERASLTAQSFVTASGGDLRAACTELWKQGFFGTGPVPAQFDVCELPQGAPGVFPGESGSVCPALGLREADVPSSDEQLFEFQHQASAAVREPDCLTYDQAHAVVEHYLAKFGMHGWTIGRSPNAVPFSAEYPCASLYVPPGQTTVMIVPDQLLPGQTAPSTTG